MTNRGGPTAHSWPGGSSKQFMRGPRSERVATLQLAAALAASNLHRWLRLSNTPNRSQYLPCVSFAMSLEQLAGRFVYNASIVSELFRIVSVCSVGFGGGVMSGRDIRIHAWYQDCIHIYVNFLTSIQSVCFSVHSIRWMQRGAPAAAGEKKKACFYPGCAGNFGMMGLVQCLDCG